MAKSLEEHLYRSALTKEEYMDQSTLRDRLQNIAQNLESHQSNNMNSNNQMQNRLQQNETRQLHELLRAQGGNNNNNNGGGMNQMDDRNNTMGGMMGGNNNNMNDRRRSAQQQIEYTPIRNSSGDSGGSSSGDPQKVIRQQQQRLLLLRHASKCKLGPECTTRFCAQMKPLWQHMKRCRDKDCQTRHCQSSRCVLTHYRICKSQGKTATCEICGPVMEHIQRQERADGLDSSDPLADKDSDTNIIQNQQGDMRNMSVFGGQDDIQKNAAAAKRQLQEQVLRQQQQQQNQMGSNPQQMLLQLQQMQMRFQQQQIVINKLKNQQQQLSDQQQQLQRNPQSGPQAQNQLRLLQQLEMRAKQQQQIEYQELMMQHKNIQQMQLKIKATQQQQQQNQLAQQLGGQQNQLNQMNSMGMSNMNNMNNMNTMNNMNNVNNQNNNANNQNNNANNQNNSQQLSTSQRSHHSNTSNNSQQGSRQRRRSSIQQQQQQQQVTSSMNDMLSQNLQKAINEPNPSSSPSSNKNDDPLVGNLLDDAQSNPLSQLDALDASLDVDDSQEVLELPEELGSLDQALEDSPKKESNDRDDGNKDTQPVPLSEASSGGNELSLSKSSDQGLEDNSERSQGSKSKRRKTASGAVDKGPRGRGGGKGKRLREIEKINLSNEAEGSSGSLSGIKRSADEMSKSKNDVSPDTETSSGAAAGNKKGGQPSLPKGDVEQHLLMLNKGLHLTSRTITHKCLPIVQQLIDDPYGWVFRDAVDPVLFGLPDYFEVVKNPMHLLLVKKKLENAVYTDMASFERDVKLVFENAILYNGEESDVGTLAKTMKGVFETEYKKVCEGM